MVEETETSWCRTKVTKIKLKTYREPSALDRIRAVVAFFHGMCSHTNEGSHIAKELAKNGYEVVGFDQRGFGKSEGRRGFIRSFETLLVDSEMFLAEVRKVYPDKQIFLHGISLGGLTCAAIAIRKPEEYAGCILMAPAIKSFWGKWAHRAAGVLSTLFPTTQISKRGQGSKRGSKNPNVSELRRSDKYRYMGDPYITTLHSVLDGSNAYRGRTS